MGFGHLTRGRSTTPFDQTGANTQKYLIRQDMQSLTTYILSSTCAPEAQDKLFKKMMRLTSFPRERFIPLDIRGTVTKGSCSGCALRWKSWFGLRK